MTPPRLLSPDLLDPCLEALRHAEVEAGNVPSRSMVATEFLGSVLAWHAETELRLSFLLAQGDLHELLYSPRLWALRAMDPTAPAARDWAELELRARTAALAATRNALAEAQGRWRRDSGTIVVPDTNLLLHHANTLLYIPWRQVVQARADVRVVLLLRVIDELDNQKRHGKTPEARTRARATLTELRGTHIAGGASRHTLLTEEYATTTLEVLADDWHHRRLPDSDMEIVDRAAALSEMAGRRVTVVTSDGGMEVRAGMADVDVLYVDTKT